MMRAERAYASSPRVRAPADTDAPDVKRVKQLAARVGRALYDQDRHVGACLALRKYLHTLPPDRIRYWAGCPILDPRWDGATGQGGYWAAATAAVNRIAGDVLTSKEYRDRHGLGPLFEVVSSSAKEHGA